MSNTNCLQGIACPKCQSQGPFNIHACAIVEMTDDGSDSCTDIEWQPASVITCRVCEHPGKVRDFTAEKLMEEYSVLLRYPDYMNDGGNETYYGFTTAQTPQEAIINVQIDATRENSEQVQEWSDFAALLVLPGHIKGLSTE